MNQSNYLNVYTVEEFDAPTKDDKNHKAKSWTKVGAAFPHKDGIGFSIELRAIPLDGRLVALPPKAEDERGHTSARNRR
jgi:hypothetical protein